MDSKSKHSFRAVLLNTCAEIALSHNKLVNLCRKFCDLLKLVYDIQCCRLHSFILQISFADSCCFAAWFTYFDRRCKEEVCSVRRLAPVLHLTRSVSNFSTN